MVLDEAQRSVLQQYAAIREALDREEQTALQCVSKEESRVLRGLEEKVGGLRSSLQSVQQGLHILEGLADAKGDKGINGQVFIRVCAVGRLIFLLLNLKWSNLNADAKVIYLILSHWTGIQKDGPPVSAVPEHNHV